MSEDKPRITATPADGVSLIEVDPEQLAALEREVLDERGRQTPQPAATYEKHTQATISAFCVRNGVYNLVTNELVEWIREEIAQRPAIEIGSGDGVLAKALDIPGTDNYMQEWRHIRKEYERLQQPPIRYGFNVERLDGAEAVIKYRPDVIIASWLTHKWLPEEHERGGNMYGVDDRYLLANCRQLIFIGNTSTHAKHRLLEKTHLYWEFPWLYSRAVKGKNFIAVWRGGKG